MWVNFKIKRVMIGKTDNKETKMAIEIDTVCEAIANYAPQIDVSGEFPYKSIDVLRRYDLLKATIPIEFGGLGLSAKSISYLIERLAEICASTAMVYVMHLTALNSLIFYSNPHQKEKFLKKVVSDGVLLTEAISEPTSGSQWWSIHSQSITTLSGFEIIAEKSFVTSAGHAGMYVLSTMAPDSNDSRNMAVFLVNGDIEGISAGTWNGLGLRGNSSAKMSFRCHVESDALLYGGEDNDGFKKYNEVNQPIYHLGIASVYLGISKAAFKTTVNRINKRSYISNTSKFGTSLNEYPIAHRHVGEIKMKIFLLEGFIRNFCKKVGVSNFDDISSEMTALKVAATETAFDVCHQALMACGGSAYVKGLLSIERNLRDASAGALMGPNNDFCKEFIGKMELGLLKYNEL